MTEAEQFIQESGQDVGRMSGHIFFDEAGEVFDNYALRSEHIRRYGFAVITEKVIAELAAHLNERPLLEVGAGSGYWAYELARNGVDVIATDPGIGRYGMGWKEPGAPQRWKHHFCEIEKLTGIEAVAKYPDRQLLFVWPDYSCAWPAETLQAYLGDLVFYAGEGEGGCTGDDRFHDLLDKDFALIDTIAIPQWSGIHDELHVYRRIV
jgi:hypothetical protein